MPVASVYFCSLLIECDKFTLKHEILQELLQPFNNLFSRTTWVSRYQKGKTNLDFTGARDSERQWHQLSHMQVCTSLQTDNHVSTPPLCFSQAGCPSCRPTNSVKALKALQILQETKIIHVMSIQQKIKKYQDTNHDHRHKYSILYQTRCSTHR